MATTPQRRAAASIFVLGLALAACGGTPEAAANEPTHEAPATNSDLVTMAIRLGELERRVEKLEGGGAEGTATGEHATDEHATETSGDAAEHASDPAADHATETSGDHAATAEPAADAAHGATPHWGYADAAHWGELAAEFATCSTGGEQSPIDLTQAQPASIADAELAYVPAAASVTDNGHTVQVNLTDAGGATVDGREYALKQFHFHAPSEHTVDGVHAPVEAHFVHADAEGNLAVIGVMIIEGAPHPMFDEIIATIPAAGSEAPLPTPVDARSLMPEGLMAYRYAGSLTTPPCTEGVTWSVLQQPITWSPEQVTALAAHFAEANNRPVQPLNYRELQVDLVPG